MYFSTLVKGKIRNITYNSKSCVKTFTVAYTMFTKALVNQKASCISFYLFCSRLSMPFCINIYIITIGANYSVHYLKTFYCKDLMHVINYFIATVNDRSIKVTQLSQCALLSHLDMIRTIHKKVGCKDIKKFNVVHDKTKQLLKSFNY